MDFMLKKREIQKSKIQKFLFVSTVISVSVVLILNLLCFLF